MAKKEITIMKKLLMGLILINNEQPEAQCDAQQDVLYAGDVGESTETSATMLLELGWHKDSESGSWAFFT